MFYFLKVPGGLTLPLVLPLRPDGSTDWEMLERMVIEYIRLGVKAFFLASTTGRVHELNARGRGKLFTFVQGVCARNGGATLMVGCMDTCLERMLEHLCEVARVGCRMVVTSPPWYARLGQHELTNARRVGVLDVFAQEAANKDVGVIWYDHPHAGRMSVDTILRLAEHPNSAGIKDSSGENRAADLAPVVPYFIGREDLILEAMRNGASGCVCSLAHIHPQLFQCLIELAGSDEAGSSLDAQTLQGVIEKGYRTFINTSELRGGAFSVLMRYLEVCLGIKLTRSWEGMAATPSDSREFWRTPNLLPGVEPVWFGE